MKKLFLVLAVSFWAFSTNAQTWVLTNTGAAGGKLRTCTGTALSATDFRVWISGDNHGVNGRSFANGNWSSWTNTGAASGTNVYSAEFYGISNGELSFLKTYNNTVWTDYTITPTSVTLASASDTVVDATFNTSSTTDVLFGVTRSGKIFNGFSGLPTVQVTTQPLVGIEPNDQVANKHIIASRDGFIFIVNGVSTMTVTNPTTFTKTKGFRALGYDGLDTYVAVGDTGTIQRSVDGGNTWTVISSGTTQNLNGLQVINDLEFIVVGDNGTVRKTTNGGTSWTTISVPTTQNLNDILDFNLFGVIVGDNGTVLTYGLGATPACAFTASATNIVDATNSLCNGQVTFTTPNPQPGNVIDYKPLAGSVNYAFAANVGTLTQNNLCAGNYILRVVELDDPGNEVTCADTLIFTVGGTAVQNCTLSTSYEVIATEGCDSVAYTVTGGTAPYQLSVSFPGSQEFISNHPASPFGRPDYCPATYRAIITDANGCKDTISVDINADLPVSIKDISAEIGLSVYPNPAKTQLNVSANVVIESILITDIVGRVVMMELVTNQSKVIALENFSNGMFTIQIKTSEGICVKKFIKD